MEDHLVAKIVSMCFLGGVSLVLGLIPIKFMDWIKRRESIGQGQARTFLSALSCFGAGVILTTCFTHMLPEVNELLLVNIDQGLINDTGLPLVEILFLTGFIMIYAVEELSRVFATKINHPVLNVKCECNMVPGDFLKDEVKSPDPLNSSIETSTTDQDEEKCRNLDDASSKNSFQAAMRGFVVILALSLHAIFEGVAMGLSTKAQFIWYFCFAVAAHKFIIAFCVGVQLVSSGTKNALVILYMCTFSLVTPLGIGIGISLVETVDDESSVQNVAVTVLQGLAAGTLLYVVFFEVLEKERQSNTNGILKVAFLALGFGVMLAVQLLEVHDHSHGGHVDKHPSVCQIQPSLLANYNSPIRIICNQGNITIVPVEKN